MDRNIVLVKQLLVVNVALRKESVDRNCKDYNRLFGTNVALRKESVDRNIYHA